MRQRANTNSFFSSRPATIAGGSRSQSASRRTAAKAAHAADLLEPRVLLAAPTINDQFFEVDEDAASPANGGGIVAQLVAADPEGGPLAYEILSGNTDNAFELDPQGGHFVVDNEAALDFDTNPQFTIRVRVTDLEQRTAEADVTINIIPENRPPFFPGANGFSPIYDVDENSASRSQGGISFGTLFAQDPDGDPLTFSILSGNDDGIFEVDAATGDLFVADSGLLDAEVTELHTLVVEARDDFMPAGTATQTIRIEVNDVDEFGIEAADFQDFTVESDATLGTIIGTVLAVDPDFSATLEFEIFAPNNSSPLPFAIDPFSGELIVTETPLEQPSYTFDVFIRSFSNGVETDFDSVEVFVGTISDTADPPVFDNASLAVFENSAAGTSVGFLRVSNPQAGRDYGFSIVGGGSGAFALNDATGDTVTTELIVADASQLDFETRRRFTLEVQATDAADPTLFDTAMVIVNVLNDPADDVVDPPVVDADGRPVITLAGDQIVEQFFVDGEWTSRTTTLESGIIESVADLDALPYVGNADGDVLRSALPEGSVPVTLPGESEQSFLTNLFVGNFDGDGSPDLAGYDEANRRILVGTANADGDFEYTVWQTLSADVNWINFRMGDFDGDGLDDLALQESNFGKWYFAIATPEAAGGPRFVTQSWGDSFGSTVPFAGIEAADVDGDGKDELIALNAVTGFWLVGFVFDEPTFETWAQWTTTARWENVLVGDFDGDGRDDVAAQTTFVDGDRDGVWYVAPTVLTQGNGPSNPDEVRGRFVGQKWTNRWNPAWGIESVRAVDIDGDGRDDLIGHSTNGGFLVGVSTGIPLDVDSPRTGSGFDFTVANSLRPINDPIVISAGFAPERPVSPAFDDDQNVIDDLMEDFDDLSLL